MVENGVKIIDLEELLAMVDGYFFPVADASGTKRVSWDTLKADLLGSYELWPHDIPGSTDEIVTLRNTSDVDEFSILEIRAPGNGVTLESTLSLHNYSAALAKDWVRDLSLHNYSGNMHAIDVLSCFTDATYGDWKWIANNPVGRGEFQAMRLYGETGNLVLAGYVRPSGGYRSVDNTAGATGSFTTGTLVVKNGLVVGGVA